MTLNALKWPLTRMSTPVRDQVVFLGKGFVALLAFIRLLTRVKATVPFQVKFQRKAATTLTAFIRLLTRVDIQVCGQITWKPEVFVALCALIPLLTFVGLHIHFRAASLPGCVCKERARVFCFTQRVVGRFAQWQATDFPLAYIPFAVIAMLDKRSEF